MPNSLPSSTRRLVGLLLMLSGALLGLGILLKLATGMYAWYRLQESLLFSELTIYLVALLASGLLMRWGRQIRRGESAHRDPNANEIL